MRASERPARIEIRTFLATNRTGETLDAPNYASGRADR